MAYSIACLIKTVKKYVVNNRMNDESFVREFFSPYIQAGMVKDKNNNELELDKSRVSRLITQKDDVPASMKNALSVLDFKEKLASNFSTFIEDYFDSSKVNICKDDIMAEINADTSFDVSVKKILSSCTEFAEFLAVIFIETVKRPNVVQKISDVELWRNGNNSLSVINGDLFKYGFENRSKSKNIVVIPVNSSFETHLSTKLENDELPLVSENTIHGQWLLRWIKSGKSIEELDDRILKNIDKQKLKPTRTSIADNGKQDCYELGTIVSIETEKSVYYLAAISDFDENNNAQSAAQKIEVCLAKLIDFYDKFGQGYSLYLPLMGTGRSRANLSHQESFDLIVKTFVNNKHKIQGHIGIVIEPSAFKNIDVNLKEEQYGI